MNESTVGARTEHYEPPAVIYEAALEVRAGTPLGLPQSRSDPAAPAQS